MSRGSSIDVIGVIDEARISPFQRWLFVLLFTIAAADGFDTQSIAFVAPAISRELGFQTGSFGPIFSAGLLGTAIGAVGLGVLSDRIGRRWSLIASVVVIALATGACAIAPSYNSLIVYRMIAGVGLGGAINNSLALISEFAPQRARATAVTACLWGFPLGATAGGVFAGDLIAAFGWQSVFFIGAIIPLLMAPILLTSLPESIRFLMLDPDKHGALIATLLSKICPGRKFSPTDAYYLSESSPPRGTVRSLFSNGLAAATILIWITVFFSCVLIYCLVNWIPSVLHEAGTAIKIAALGTAAFNFAGIAGSYVFSKLTKAHPLRVLAIAYFAGAAAIATVAQEGHATIAVLATIFAAGFFIIGAQISVTAYTTNYYPTSIRSTGAGWYQAVSRVGSMVGPLAGGFVLSGGGQPSRMFVLCAIPAVCAGASLFVLATIDKKQKKENGLGYIVSSLSERLERSGKESVK